MNRLIVSSLLIVLVAVVIAPVLDDGGPAPAASAGAAVQAVPETPAAASGGEVVIDRDGTGQFRIEGDLGGTPVSFLVDTGADVVALSMDDAQRLGIAPDPASFAPVLRTASGMGYGAPVRIERLTVADRDLEDVPAVVVRGLSVSLLGQSALRRLGRVTLEGDRLVIGS